MLGLLGVLLCPRFSKGALGKGLGRSWQELVLQMEIIVIPGLKMTSVDLEVNVD